MINPPLIFTDEEEYDEDAAPGDEEEDEGDEDEEDEDDLSGEVGPIMISEFCSLKCFISFTILTSFCCEGGRRGRLK